MMLIYVSAVLMVINWEEQLLPFSFASFLLLIFSLLSFIAHQRCVVSAGVLDYFWAWAFLVCAAIY